VHLGDASGDGVSDVGLSAASVSTPASRSVAVLDGATGETAFVVAGDLIRAVGDVDRDGLAEVGTQTIHVGAKEAGAFYETYDGDGTIRLYREHLVPVGESETATVALMPSIGDVDGDGLDDAGQRVTILAGAETKQHDLTVSSRGYEAGAQAPMGTALGESLDGSGDDFVEIDPFGESAVDVIARDGATGAELWVTRLLPRGRTTESTFVQAVEVTGDGRADLVISAQTAEPGTLPPDFGGQIRKIDAFVLDGASGAILWDAQ
jgi:hypothetical protein